MENDILQDKYMFPKLVADACRILVGLKNRYGNKDSRLTEANDGVAFATINEDEKKGNKKKDVTCYKCNKVGYYTNECDKEQTLNTSNKKGTNLLVHINCTHDSSSEEYPGPGTDVMEAYAAYASTGLEEDDPNTNMDTTDVYEEPEESLEKSEEESKGESDEYDGMHDYTDDEYEGFAFLQDDIMCSLKDKLCIPKSWILPNSQSTVDMFSKKKLLSNILDMEQTLTLYCNAGRAIVTQKGDLKGYGTVWYYPDGIANILSLSNVQKKHKDTYDSYLDTGLVVHKADGMNRLFMPLRKGLFFSEVKEGTVDVTLNTVNRIKNKYTVKEYSDAKKV